MSDTDDKECLTEIMEKVFAQREEILMAFLAKYKLQPDEVEQVSKCTYEGYSFHIRKREK